MKSATGMMVVALVVGAIVLLLAMSARAGERGDDPALLEVSTPPADPAPPDDAPPVDADAGQVLLDVSGTIGGDEPRPPSPSAQKIHESLVAISPGGGTQLPPVPEIDRSGWQQVDVGLATMRVPADWTVQTHVGSPGDDDETIGLAPPAMDLYVELRQIRNADSNYLQTAGDHAQSEYSRSPDRLKEGVILGYQPLQLGGAAGHVEVMNQYGKEFDDDGTRTFRLILWRGRWDGAESVHRIEFQATFAQDRYDAVAPLVAAILATVATRADAAAP